MDEACVQIAEVLGIDTAAMGPYAARLHMRCFLPGAAVYDSRVDQDSALIVTRGFASTSVSLGDLEVASGIASKADLLGTDAFNKPAFYVRAVALTTLTIVEIPFGLVNELLESRDEFGEALYIRLCASIGAVCRLVGSLRKVDALSLTASMPPPTACEVPRHLQVANMLAPPPVKESSSCPSLESDTVSWRFSACTDSGYAGSGAKRVRIGNRAALTRLRTGRTVH